MVRVFRTSQMNPQLLVELWHISYGILKFLKLHVAKVQIKTIFAFSEPKPWDAKWTATLGDSGKPTPIARHLLLILSSSPFSLLREGRRVWRRVLEGSHPCPVLCQRQGLDLLWPACDQAGRPAESAGILHSLLPLLLPEPHSHLQLEEEGKLAISVSFLPRESLCTLRITTWARKVLLLFTSVEQLIL